MKIILQHLKPYNGMLILVAFMHAAATFASLLMPYVMSITVDRGLVDGNAMAIIFSAIVMVLIAAVSLLCSIVSNNLNARVATGFTSSVFRSIFKKVNSLSVEQYSRIGSSGLLTRSTDDVFNLEGAAEELVYTVVTVPIMLIGGTVLSLAQDAALALIFLVSVPPVLIFILILVKPLSGMWDKADSYIDMQNRIIRERLGGLRVVRAFNNEDREHGRASHATEEMAKYIIRSNVRGGYIEPCAMLLLNLATVLIIYVGKERALRGDLADAGQVIALIQYVALIANAVLMLSWTIAWLPKLRVSAKRIGEIFDMPKEDVGAEDASTPVVCDGGASIELREVSFTYPDSKLPILKNISLHIKNGESVAIIGGTGSGKSTLIKLLLSFYDVSEGEIYLDGDPYSTLKKQNIRAHYSASLQRGMIFEGTVRDNINMGKRDADDSELLENAAHAELYDFITDKKEGLSYLLVGSGQNISGGQKQRCNMTRALVKNAPIYVFDDSFSALDFLTERRIQSSLNKRLAGKTRITVTQRVSTALAADRIICMDKGEIVGTGSHQELIQSCEVYREICISQLGRESVGGDEIG